MKILFTLILATILILTSQTNLSFSEEELALKHSEEYQAKIPVTVIKEIPLPKGYHEGLLLEGDNIWVSNGEGFKTWVIDPEEGTVMSEIEPVGTFTEGVTRTSNGVLWLSDWEDKKIYRVKKEENKLVSEFELDLAPARPAGIVSAGDTFYVITWTRGIGTKYHLMQFDNNGVELKKMRIKRIHEPSQLAWDGKNLWISSWFSQLVYKIDIESLSIIGSFKSPAPKTTGILWDGEHFWVTGTHANLYQLKFSE